jgi:hypothetical protein
MEQAKTASVTFKPKPITQINRLSRQSDLVPFLGLEVGRESSFEFPILIRRLGFDKRKMRVVPRRGLSLQRESRCIIKRLDRA